MYHLSTLLVTLLALAGLAFAQTPETLGYDNHYDEGRLSLDDVACSNGVYGLETKGYTTLSSLPTFPNVGGAFTIAGWNSPNCGACYAITYGEVTINVTAIDKSEYGFTLSETAMNTLTGGWAVDFGRVEVTFVQLEPSACGLPST